jgi:hypothetical protein
MIKRNRLYNNGKHCILNARMDGTNNGSTFIDSSSYARSISRGGIVTVTGTKKFGTASAYNSGTATSNLLEITESSDFIIGNKKFTIRGWFYTITLASNLVFGQYDDSAHYWDIYMAYNDGTNGINMNIVDTTTQLGQKTSTYTQSNFNDTFHELVVTFDRNIVRIYRDGIVGTMTIVTAASLTNVDLASSLKIFRTRAGNSYQGYIDNFQFINGNCLANRNFKPSNRAA